MATQSSSTTTGAGSSSALMILQGLTTTRNPEIWQHYNLCKASGGAFFKYDVTCVDPTQNTTTEKTAGPNRSISGYETSLAARDAVSFQFRRDMWPVFTGRKDGRVSLASEVGGNLPSANANFTTLLSQFGSKGLNLNDLVTLSGAHTIGISHCTLVARRLYNFTGKGDADPSLDATYALTLRNLCPNPINPATPLEMISRVLENPKVFFDQFAQSMVHMGAIEVLTNGQGEVRINCSVVN
ncbi:peroxidase 24-like protein [Tanacetum coccineum]